jgi:hypothetical protein
VVVVGFASSASTTTTTSTTTTQPKPQATATATTTTTTMITAMDGKPLWGFFSNFFYDLLIFCFSYDYYLNRLNDHDDDSDNHTHRPLQLTPSHSTRRNGDGSNRSNGSISSGLRHDTS